MLELSCWHLAALPNWSCIVRKGEPTGPKYGLSVTYTFFYRCTFPIVVALKHRLSKCAQIFKPIPDRCIAQQQAQNQDEVDVVEKGDGNNGCCLHGPGQWIPHVPQKYQNRTAMALWELIWTILFEALLPLSCAESFVIDLNDHSTVRDANPNITVTQRHPHMHIHTGNAQGVSSRWHQLIISTAKSIAHVCYAQCKFNAASRLANDKFEGTRSSVRQGYTTKA